MNRFRQISILGLLGFTMISQLAFAQSKRLPAYRTAEERALMQQQKPARHTYGKAGTWLPANIRYPGEFEESQAIAISWADGYDFNGNPTGNIDTTDIWGYVSAWLCDDIQEECPVWIRVSKASDTTRALTFMANRGKPLYNYKFFVTQGDGWWMRDFGPNGVYYGSQDSLAFIDIEYYPGRPNDNTFPRYLANKMGIPNYESTLYGEGGNLMADGFGRIFYSTMLTDVNTDASAHSPVWSLQQTNDTMSALFNCNNISLVRTLECDGGTGHIDLYLKMIDEQTLMVSQYPSVIRAQDRQIIEDNYQYLTTLKSTYNRPFRIFRIPHATGDNGKYVDTTCSQINADARTFVNGLTVNKMFIYPSYSDGVSGNQAQTDSITKLFEYIMPGYKVRPIDSRSISPLGGELHCITMQIPAEDPVLFWHPSIDGMQPFSKSFHIMARISNHTGIQSAVCKWRKKGAATWNTLTLSDSSGYFIGVINDNSLTEDDKIEYYLSATTVGGKTAVKPITAPAGFYNVYFKIGTGYEHLQVTEKNYLFGAYPNPASSEINIPFYVMESGALATLVILDINGKEVATYSANGSYGLNKINIPLSDWKNGVYFCSYQLNGEYIATRKFIIAR